MTSDRYVLRAAAAYLMIGMIDLIAGPCPGTQNPWALRPGGR